MPTVWKIGTVLFAISLIFGVLYSYPYVVFERESYSSGSLHGISIGADAEVGIELASTAGFEYRHAYCEERNEAFTDVADWRSCSPRRAVLALSKGRVLRDSLYIFVANGRIVRIDHLKNTDSI